MGKRVGLGILNFIGLSCQKFSVIKIASMYISICVGRICNISKQEPKHGKKNVCQQAKVRIPFGLYLRHRNVEEFLKRERSLS